MLPLRIAAMKGEILLTTVINGRGKKSRKDGTLPIQIRAYQDRKRRLYPSGLYVLPHQWDNNNRLVQKHPLANEYNAELTAQKLSYQRHILDLKRTDKVPTLQRLDNFREYGPIKSFIDFIAHELEKDVTLSKGTRRNHQQTLNKLIEYRPDTNFSDLSYLWVEQWDAFLRKQKLSVNSIHGHHGRIVRYIHLAEKKELFANFSNPYHHFKRKTEKTSTIALSLYEVAALEALELSSEPHLERVRDLFLYCCYTGLRAADAVSLRFCDIDRDDKGYTMNIIAQKTGKQLLSTLYKLYNGKPQCLIQQYETRRKVAASSPELVFLEKSDGLTNQYLNRILKALGKRANIKKRLTSHVGRHTFVTDMFSRASPGVVKELVQHGSIATTMRYAHLQKKHIDDALDKIDWE